MGVDVKDVAALDRARPEVTEGRRTWLPPQPYPLRAGERRDRVRMLERPALQYRARCIA